MRRKAYPGLTIWVLHSITCILIGEREIKLKNTGEVNTESQVGGNKTMETEVGVLWPQPRNACSHQKLEEARYGFSPRALEKRTL